MEKDHSEATQQLEYYMSDANLKCDVFFRDLIQEHPEGYVNVNSFLRCNKVKRLGATEDSLIAAAGLSDLLEINEARTCIRRKDNLALPDLDIGKSLNIQPAKPKGASANIENLKVVEKQITNKNEFVPLIVAIRNHDEIPKTNGKDLEESVEK